jgi:hypothetical protein
VALEAALEVAEVRQRVVPEVVQEPEPEQEQEPVLVLVLVLVLGLRASPQQWRGPETPLPLRKQRMLPRPEPWMVSEAARRLWIHPHQLNCYPDVLVWPVAMGVPVQKACRSVLKYQPRLPFAWLRPVHASAPSASLAPRSRARTVAAHRAQAAERRRVPQAGRRGAPRAGRRRTPQAERGWAPWAEQSLVAPKLLHPAGAAGPPEPLRRRPSLSPCPASRLPAQYPSFAPLRPQPR